MVEVKEEVEVVEEVIEVIVVIAVTGETGVIEEIDVGVGEEMEASQEGAEIVKDSKVSETTSKYKYVSIHFLSKFRPGAITKGRHEGRNEDNKGGARDNKERRAFKPKGGRRRDRGDRGDRRGGRGGRDRGRGGRGGRGDRKPIDKAKHEEDLNEEMYKFQRGQGNSVEVFEAAKQKKLDDQMKEFMEQQNK